MPPTVPEHFQPAPGEPVQVRPVRAAFGPAISLVSVDEQGRLWMRVSTALVIMLTGLVMFVVPLAAMWWVGVGLMDSGQISINDQTETPSEVSTLPPAGRQKR
jgi:hypothetical protein